MPAVLAASSARHVRVLPDRPELVKFLALIRGLFVEALRFPVAETPILGDMPRLLAYLKATMAFELHEEVRVLFLNTGNMLLRDEVIARGDTLSAAIYPREILRRALELGASALVLAHNHPSGDPTPSATDIRITRTLAEAARSLEIMLHDHIIIGRCGYVSMHEQRLI